MRYVYIAGPMRGYPGYNFEMFQRANAVVFEHFGHDVEVFNPALKDIVRHNLGHFETWAEAGQWLLDNPQEFSLRAALGEDTAWISEHATDIVLLPGWEDSLGARAERALADALGLTIWYIPECEDGDLRVVSTEYLPVDTFLPVVSGWQTPMVGPLTEETAAEVFGGEVRTTSASGGEKGVKPEQYRSIPPAAMSELAVHFARGAAKYADHNFRKGYPWSLGFDSAMRHWWAFWGGKDYDVCPEDGEGCAFVTKDGEPFPPFMTPHGQGCYNHTASKHVIAAAWHALVTATGMDEHPEYDDRYKRSE